MKFKMLIFDLDGTLYDTSGVNYLAYKEALNNYGFDIEKDYFYKCCNGYHYTTFIPKIIGDNSDIIETIHNEKKSLYFKNLKEARENTLLFEIIEKLKKDYYIAIVTTASKKNCLEILNHFHRQELFDLIVTAEDIKIQKPDPYGYNKVIEYFKIDKKDVFIFEDSDVGVESAIRSGANVITITKF